MKRAHATTTPEGHEHVFQPHTEGCITWTECECGAKPIGL